MYALFIRRVYIHTNLLRPKQKQLILNNIQIFFFINGAYTLPPKLINILISK